jgi:deoxyribose-phosphate aldolase
MAMDEKQLAGFIDHTLLAATATSSEIKKLCEEAKQYQFYSVSVNPRWVGLAADLLAGSPPLRRIKVDAAISLPLGADSTKVKVAAAKDAIFAGADEIDMVADLSAIIEGDERYLGRQLREVLQVCRSMRPPVLLKVIIEAAALRSEQERFACEVADRCGADFVKTSTGMHPAGGATIEDVRLMKEAAPHCKTKAAGGIRTAKQVLEFIDAGADRIGTSAGVQIIEEFLAGRL